MGQLVINDLNFFESAIFRDQVKGGAIAPRISTALQTDIDTRLVAQQRISGDLENGFRIDIVAVGSAAAAAAAAASVGGSTIVIARARA
ncbi:hypothetical protein [Leptothermofonsia sp. ETS-13]|uniref:hypothetical protein n=1 Tax=Leptothermofonsia sp. ETS-13 TaxID=3035696 RepID=UPI003B9F44F9